MSIRRWSRRLGWLSVFLSCVCSGSSAKHSQLELERGRWCDLPGWAEGGLHSPELPGTGSVHDACQPVLHEVIHQGNVGSDLWLWLCVQLCILSLYASISLPVSPHCSSITAAITQQGKSSPELCRLICFPLRTAAQQHCHHYGVIDMSGWHCRGENVN